MGGFETLRGLIAAPFTPMDGDGVVDLRRIEAVAEHLVATGVRGVFVCGTTGESLSLTMQERMEVAERWVQVAGGRLRVIVHVGENCRANAVALAGHAQKVGADGVSAMPTVFFRPGNVRETVEWMKPVAGAARELPFYYYHIPSMTGVAQSMVALLRVASEEIANFGGIKFTHNDLPEYQQCLQEAGEKLDVSFGRDEALLAALAMGARSAVGSTYNYSAAIYLKMMKAFEAGDMAGARMWSHRAIEAIDVLVRHGGLRCGKAIMEMVGVDAGPARAPIAAVSREERAEIHGELERMGFFEWVR